MGTPAKSLPKAVRDRAGIALGPGGCARPALGPAVVGHVLLELAIDPPAATHHAKRIVARAGHSTLADGPDLVAARRLYELAIPPRPGPLVPPLRPPVVLRVTFTFAGRPDAPAGWHVRRPDLDNQVKLLADVLAARGYVADDAHVALQVLAKRTAPVPGVRVYLRTLLSADDVGHELAARGPRRPGWVDPLPDGAVWDAACGPRVDLWERPYPGFPPRASQGGGGAANRTGGEP